MLTIKHYNEKEEIEQVSEMEEVSTWLLTKSCHNTLKPKNMFDVK